MRPGSFQQTQKRQNWAKIFENAELCAERIENAIYCYRGEYDINTYEKAESFEKAIRNSLGNLRSRRMQDADWKIIKAAASMYENLKFTLPKADSLDDEEYDKQIDNRLYIIAQKAASNA